MKTPTNFSQNLMTKFEDPIMTLADSRPQIWCTCIIYPWKRQKSLQIHGSQWQIGFYNNWLGCHGTAFNRVCHQTIWSDYECKSNCIVIGFMHWFWNCKNWIENYAEYEFWIVRYLQGSICPENGKLNYNELSFSSV